MGRGQRSDASDVAPGILYGAATPRRSEVSSFERLLEASPSAVAGLLLDNYDEKLNSLLIAICQQAHLDKGAITLEVVDVDYDETGIDFTYDLYATTIDGEIVSLSDDRPTGKHHFELDSLIELGLHEDDEEFANQVKLELGELEEKEQRD